MVEQDLSQFFSEIIARITELEDKQRLIQDRVALISKTLLSNVERTNKEISTIKDEISELREKIDRIKEALEHIMKESAEFARKSEVAVLEKYIKLWEPLKYATLEDVKRMIERAIAEFKLKEKLKTKNEKKE